MKAYTAEELQQILVAHVAYLKNEIGGVRADLAGADLTPHADAIRGANLRGAYLRDANLRGANLSGANLSDANLSDANLRGAYLRGANLSDANLSGAYLRGAYLRGAYLRGAYLSGADLRDAYLRGANLSGAYLRGANLSGANLSDANLSGAYLSGANLSGANLSGAKELDNAIFPGGFTFEVYKRELVPALLTAGGKTLEEVVATSWECHEWTNCPMATAFGVHEIDDIPPLYREQARLFVSLFDAGLIPNPLGEAEGASSR